MQPSGLTPLKGVENGVQAMKEELHRQLDRWTELLDPAAAETRMERGHHIEHPSLADLVDVAHRATAADADLTHRVCPNVGLTLAAASAIPFRAWAADDR